MEHKSITTTMDAYAQLPPTKKFDVMDNFLFRIEELASGFYHYL